jgi:hypothetical protein
LPPKLRTKDATAGHQTAAAELPHPGAGASKIARSASRVARGSALGAMRGLSAGALVLSNVLANLL